MDFKLSNKKSNNYQGCFACIDFSFPHPFFTQLCIFFFYHFVILMLPRKEDIKMNKKCLKTIENIVEFQRPLRNIKNDNDLVPLHQSNHVWYLLLAFHFCVIFTLQCLHGCLLQVLHLKKKKKKKSIHYLHQVMFFFNYCI